MTERDYKVLTDLHKTYSSRGLQVLGFPCNQFSNGEPGTSFEIRLFVKNVYEAAFPLLTKSEVNGPQTNPVYKLLRRRSSLHSESKNKTQQVPWNFTKFIVSADSQHKVEFVSPIKEYKEIEQLVLKALESTTNVIE